MYGAEQRGGIRVCTVGVGESVLHHVKNITGGQGFIHITGVLVEEVYYRRAGVHTCMHNLRSNAAEQSRAEKAVICMHKVGCV